MTAAVAPQAGTIVVVNDDLAQLNLFVGLLRKIGCDTRAHRTANEALGAMPGHPPPALLITDLYMPGIDGWRFCRLARSPEFQALNQTPILVTSATYAGDEAAHLTTELGANAFLPVPFEATEFLQLVRSLLQGRTSVRTRRVLVAEDDAAQAELMGQGFRAHGYSVELALTGDEALRKCQANLPDIVVLDYHLPDRLGDTLLPEFQQRCPSLPVVMITGDPQPELALDWMNKGASAYVRKPFQVDYLIDLSERVFKERVLLRVEDILEQRTRQLREQEEKYRTVADFAVNWEYWLDPEGKFRYVSPSCERLTGYPADEFHADPELLLRIVHPEDRPAFGRHLELQARNHQPHRLEFRIVTRTGQTVWLEHWCRTVRRADGTYLGLRAGNSDITERKAAEEARQRLEAQLRHAQKMESVGRLAGGIAHDFNNIITAMLMNLNFLQDEPAIPAECREWLAFLEQGAKRAADLTRQLLTFSRNQVLEVRPLDLNELLENLMKMLGRVLGETIELSWLKAADPMWIEADTGMIEQVVMNLCLNARDAMPEGGKLSLRTQLVEVGNDRVQNNREARAGTFVCLRVQDTGCGMDEAVLKHIFEPFFTTKDVGKGTGLGLAMVYGILKQHGGWAEAESTAGRGSTFRAYLPYHPITEAQQASQDVELDVPQGNETILLVDDELGVRRSLAVFLGRLGYVVHEASNGADALHQWRQRQGRIDLLFTDLVMPGGMSGRELARQMRQLQPGLKVIYCSGYSPEIIGSESDLQPGERFLSKPFEIATLARTVRLCLDAGEEQGRGGCQPNSSLQTSRRQ